MAIHNLQVLLKRQLQGGVIVSLNEKLMIREVCKTVYQRLMQNETASLCKVKLLTGRTHQIRVHFEYIGHPLMVMICTVEIILAFMDKRYIAVQLNLSTPYIDLIT